MDFAFTPAFCSQTHLVNPMTRPRYVSVALLRLVFPDPVAISFKQLCEVFDKHSARFQENYFANQNRGRDVTRESVNLFLTTRMSVMHLPLFFIFSLLRLLIPTQQFEAVFLNRCIWSREDTPFRNTVC